MSTIPSLLKEWEKHLKNKCADTTIHLRMWPVRALVNKAINEDGFEFYPCKESTLKEGGFD